MDTGAANRYCDMLGFRRSPSHSRLPTPLRLPPPWPQHANMATFGPKLAEQVRCDRLCSDHYPVPGPIQEQCAAVATAFHSQA